MTNEDKLKRALSVMETQRNNAMNTIINLEITIAEMHDKIKSLEQPPTVAQTDKEEE